MYINPFLAGILFVIIIELLLVVGYSVIHYKDVKNDKEEK